MVCDMFKCSAKVIWSSWVYVPAFGLGMSLSIVAQRTDIVFSPLISLIKDQVDGLEPRKNKSYKSMGLDRVDPVAAKVSSF